MGYVYESVETGLHTVGFYRPDGSWWSESDHSTPEEAARRTAWLNGSDYDLDDVDLDAPDDNEDDNATLDYMIVYATATGLIDRTFRTGIPRIASEDDVRVIETEIAQTAGRDIRIIHLEPLRWNYPDDKDTPPSTEDPRITKLRTLCIPAGESEFNEGGAAYVRLADGDDPAIPPQLAVSVADVLAILDGS